jgi:putative heme transporter
MDPTTTPDHAAVPEAANDGSADEGVSAPSRRAAVLRTGLVAGVLILVFGVVLPQFINYEDVVEAFRELTLPQLLLMTGLISLAWLVNGLVFSALIPHLSPARGTAAYLILAGIGASVPMGPWNMGVVWVVLRGWGIPIRPATSGIALYGIVNQLAKLALPAIALIALEAAGLLGSQEERLALVIALLCTGILIVASVVLIAIVRSERTARWVARGVQSIASWTVRWLGRPEPDAAAGVLAFRDQLGDVVRRRGLIALVISILAQLALCGVLIVALRLVGITERTLSPTEVLAVYALVAVITIIPLSPGGAGVPELLYIAGLTTITGGSDENLITAGVVLFRAFQYFLPIPLAWILLKTSRRGRSMLPTTSELKAYSREGATQNATQGAVQNTAQGAA